MTDPTPPRRRTGTAPGRPLRRLRRVRVTLVPEPSVRTAPAPPEPAPTPAESAVAAPEPASTRAKPASTPTPRPASEPVTRGGRKWLPVLLLAVAILLGAFAGFAAERAHRLRADATTNTALTDSAATSEVTGQVTSAINTIFSYDYTDLAKTQRAASGLLTGAATCQYNQLFTSIQQQAPQQKLVVTVTVTNTGVELLDGDRARLLVFATQSSTSAVSKQTSTAGAMFTIDAQRDGNTWRIAGIDTFTGPISGC